MSIDNFFAEKAPPEIKKKHRTAAAKKGWITKAPKPNQSTI